MTPRVAFQSSSAFSATPCGILEDGNEYPTNGTPAEAIAIYRAVERVDTLGKAECAASTYASIATAHTVQAHEALPNDAARAVRFYRLASRYNRAFAATLMCKEGDCAASKDIWSGGGIWKE